MTDWLSEYSVQCPYCWETITVLIDPSWLDETPEQQYVEDCQVCCRPIEFTLNQDSHGQIQVTPRREDEG